MSLLNVIKPSLIIAVTLISTNAAVAAPCPMAYVNFQAAIPHVDVENCPAELAGKDRFCRASITGDQVHVYAFDFDGDKCLLAMKSYEEGTFKIEFNAPEKSNENASDKPAAKPAK